MQIHSHSWYHQRHHNSRRFRNIWEPPRDVPFLKAVSFFVDFAFQQKENVLPSVQTFVDLRAEHFIPIHWGTFDLAEEPLQKPPVLLQQAAAEQNVADCVHLLDIGGVFLWQLICEVTR